MIIDRSTIYVYLGTLGCLEYAGEIYARILLRLILYDNITWLGDTGEIWEDDSVQPMRRIFVQYTHGLTSSLVSTLLVVPYLCPREGERRGRER